MSLRACKTIIDENVKTEMNALAADIESFEKMFGQPGFSDKLYTAGIAIDREMLRTLQSARRQYSELRNAAAEALDS